MVGRRNLSQSNKDNILNTLKLHPKNPFKQMFE
jgi:hypothetical protein